MFQTTNQIYSCMLRLELQRYLSKKQGYLQALVAGSNLSVEAATIGYKSALAETLACWIYAACDQLLAFRAVKHLQL